MINADRLALMRDSGVIINFARGGIADDAAVLQALDSWQTALLRQRFSFAGIDSPSKSGRVTASGSVDWRG